MTKKDTGLKNKTIAELEKEAGEMRGEIAKNTLNLRMRKSKNSNLVKNLKIKLARILTFKHEKELLEVK